MTTTLNTLSDQAVDQLRQDHATLRGWVRNAMSGIKAIRDTQPEIRGVRFLNSSGEIAPAYGVMAVTAYAAGFENYYTIGKPDTTFRRLYLVNGVDDVANGNYGYTLAQPLDLCDVLYDTGATPAVAESWGPKPAQWTLAKNYYGFTILGGVTGSGATSRTRVQQHVVNKLVGKTDASHAKGASGTVSVYAGTLGSEADTTINVTAWNRFAAIASGKWIGLSWIGGGWDADSAEC